MSTVAAAVSDADHIKLKQTKTRPDRAGFCSGEQFLAKLVKAALPSTTENQRSYVEWLDGEAVENVVRHLSSKANHSQWSRFVSCRVLVSSSRLGDRFRGASLAVLEKLDTGSSIYSKDGCDVPLSELRDVLHAVEDKLKELHISRYYKMKRKQCSPWIQVLASNGATLRKLEIDDLQNRQLERDILLTVRGRVESLRVWGFHTELIGSHFVGLRELYLESTPKEDTKQMWGAL